MDINFRLGFKIANTSPDGIHYQTYEAMDHDSAVKYLELLLNRTIRAYTSDGRMFLGEFKCTDNVRHSCWLKKSHVDENSGEEYHFSQNIRISAPDGKSQEGSHRTAEGLGRCRQSRHDEQIPGARRRTWAAYSQARGRGKEVLGATITTWVTITPQEGLLARADLLSVTSSRCSPLVRSRLMNARLPDGRSMSYSTGKSLQRQMVLEYLRTSHRRPPILWKVGTWGPSLSTAAKWQHTIPNCFHIKISILHPKNLSSTSPDGSY